MPNTFALGYDTIEEFISEVHACGSDSIDFDYDHAKQLLVGALIVSEIRAAVYEETGTLKLVNYSQKASEACQVPTHTRPSWCG